MRDLYELPSVRLGMRYVVSTLFGFFLPTLRVEHGRIVSDPGQINLLEHIGGPGYLNIASGNLVLLENPAGPSNVYSAGFHFVSRREIIKEVMSLEDQHGYIESRKATTRDGIEVEVREIRYHYRLRPSRRQGELYSPRVHGRRFHIPCRRCGIMRIVVLSVQIGLTDSEPGDGFHCG